MGQCQSWEDGNNIFAETKKTDAEDIIWYFV